MLNYSSFCLSASITGLFSSRPDVVIASSPQLLLGLSGWWLAQWKRVPFVFEVRDLWPESLAAVGMGDRNSLLHRSLAKIAGFLYRKCDRVVVVTPALEEHLVEHWRVPREKSQWWRMASRRRFFLIRQGTIGVRNWQWKTSMSFPTLARWAWRTGWKQ